MQQAQHWGQARLCGAGAGNPKDSSRVGFLGSPCHGEKVSPCIPPESCLVQLSLLVSLAPSSLPPLSLLQAAPRPAPVHSLSFQNNCSNPHHVRGSILRSPQFIHVFAWEAMVSRSGLMNAGCIMSDNHLLLWAGHAPAHTAQGAIGPCGNANASNSKLYRPYFVVNLCLTYTCNYKISLLLRMKKCFVESVNSEKQKYTEN